MHLVSEVRGRLAAGPRLASTCSRAGFPAGTVSGSPKVRAMEIIDELEPARRGPYAGAVGYFDRGGDMEMCIAIRTLHGQRGRRISVQAGAGIVYDSKPAAEYQETRQQGPGPLHGGGPGRVAPCTPRPACRRPRRGRRPAARERAEPRPSPSGPGRPWTRRGGRP